MKKHLLLWISFLLVISIASCNKKAKDKQYESIAKNNSELIIGKWEYSEAWEEDGANFSIKATDDYRANKAYYSKGYLILEGNKFNFSVKGTWDIKNSHIYITCESLASPLKQIMPEFNCDIINTEPPTKIIKITNSELHYLDEDGKTKISYRVK